MSLGPLHCLSQRKNTQSSFSRSSAFTPVAYNQEDRPGPPAAPAQGKPPGKLRSEFYSLVAEAAFPLRAHEELVSLQGEGSTGRFQV